METAEVFSFYDGLLINNIRYYVDRTIEQKRFKIILKCFGSVIGVIGVRVRTRMREP